MQRRSAEWGALMDDQTPTQTVEKAQPDVLTHGKVFLKVTLERPPTRRAAKKIYATFVESLHELDAEGWQRFFDLQRKQDKPVEHVMENHAVAAVHPADHAYCLLNRLQDVDKP